MERETTLHGVPTNAMDCLQVNLAVLADETHGPGTSLRLGASAGFAPRWTTSLPTLESTVEDRVIEARELLGLVVASSCGEFDELIDGPTTKYVVADAYHLPWTPYFHQRHMDHSFLVASEGGRIVVTDAYHNDTPWGPARPTTLRLDVADLRAALPDGFTAALTFTAGPLSDSHVVEGTAWRVEPEAAKAYVAAYRDHPDRLEALEQLTLETWLLARQRLLHEVAAGEPDAALPWQRLAQQAFLAARRVAAGRPEPTSVLAELESLLLGDCTSTVSADVAAGAPSTAVRAQVVKALADVLLLPAERMATADRLADLRGFNSFRLVDVLVTLESALAVAVPPEELTAANLASVDSLTALMVRCGPSSTRPEEALTHV
jgi:acyl carrier protein